MYPIVVICLNELGVMWELLRKLRDSFRKRTTFILLQVPIREIHIVKKFFHLIFTLKEAAVHMAGIPLK
jgi:hypothetical protein